LPKQVTHRIGNDWSIVIDDVFKRSAHAGDVIFEISGRTVYCSIFHTNNAAAEEAIHKMIEGRPGIPVQVFDRHEPGLVGHAYLLPEERKGSKYWGLNTWTAARGSVCCVTIYFHDFEDFNWAIRVWKSVRPGRDGKSGLN
jgi:hypothetical protein